jgi:hypothetical protein
MERAAGHGGVSQGRLGIYYPIALVYLIQSRHNRDSVFAEHSEYACYLMILPERKQALHSKRTTGGIQSS